MPAGGNDCDCHCGGTVCTKWFVGFHSGGYQDVDAIGLLGQLADTGGGSGPNCGGGPPDRILHDSQYCRVKLEFAYDTDTHEMLITSSVPPHVDCQAGYAYDGGADMCKRRVLFGRAGFGSTIGEGVSAGITSASAARVIRLQAGWRVRARLVTDSVSGYKNTPPGMLHYLHTQSGNGFYWHQEEDSSSTLRFTPRMFVVPAQESVWKSKPCQLLGTQTTPKWYPAGEWPYAPTPPWTGYLPGSTIGDINTSKATAAYNLRLYNGKARQCFMPATAPNTPPEPHPTAPLGDKHPAIYGYLHQSGYYGIPHGFRHSGGNLWERPEGAGTLESDKVKKAPGSMLSDKYRYYPGMPNWFAVKHSQWPMDVWREQPFFDSGFPTTDLLDWHSSVWSNVDAWQAQTEPAPVEEGEPPAPEPDAVTTPPRRCFQLQVPMLERGRIGANKYRADVANPNYSSAAIHPQTVTDTAWVAAQKAGWEAHFENLTIHELTLPDYPTTSTGRPYVVETNTGPGFRWRLKYTPTTPTDKCGLTGKQNGCTKPGMCDMEMVVMIEKTGPWVLGFNDASSPVTTDGTTTVGSFIVEKLAPKESESDPDVWEAVDLRTACKPNDTPDLNGWVIEGTTAQSAARPFASIIRDLHRFVPPKRVDKGGKCKGYLFNDVGVSHLGQQNEPLFSFWSSSAPLNVIRGGATFNKFKTDNSEMWAAIPQLVVYAYEEIYNRQAVCCGYGEIKWPLVQSSCHHNYNWANIWTYDTRGLVVRRDTNHGADTHPLGNRAWTLPW